MHTQLFVYHVVEMVVSVFDLDSATARGVGEEPSVIYVYSTVATQDILT